MLQHRPAHAVGFNSRTALSIARVLLANRDVVSGGVKAISELLTGAFSGKPKGKKGRKGPARGQARIGTRKGSVLYHSMSDDTPVMSWSGGNAYRTVVAPDIGFGPGLRIVGSAYLCTITQTNAGTTIFGSPFTASGSAYSYLYVSPDGFGGRIAVLSSMWGRYVCRHLRVVFLTSVASSVSGGYAVGFGDDAATLEFIGAVNVSTIMDLTPSVYVPLRRNAVIEYNYTGDEVFFTELDVTSAGTKRETAQGILIGKMDTTAGATLASGHVIYEYVFDFYDQSTDYGISVTLKNEDEKTFVDKQLATMRSLPAEQRLLLTGTGTPKK